MTCSLRHWRAEGNVEYLDFFLTPGRPGLREYGDGAAARHAEFSARTAPANVHRVAHVGRDSPESVAGFRRVESRQPGLAIHARFRQSHRYRRPLLCRRKRQAESFGSGFDEDTTVNARGVRAGSDRVSSDTAPFLPFASPITRPSATKPPGMPSTRSTSTIDWTVSSCRPGPRVSCARRHGSFRFRRQPRPGPGAGDTRDRSVCATRPASRHRFDIRATTSNDIEDLIEFDFAIIHVAVNIDEAEIRGAAARLRVHCGDAFSMRTELVDQSPTTR